MAEHLSSEYMINHDDVPPSESDPLVPLSTLIEVIGWNMELNRMLEGYRHEVDYWKARCAQSEAANTILAPEKEELRKQTETQTKKIAKLKAKYHKATKDLQANKDQLKEPIQERVEKIEQITNEMEMQAKFYIGKLLKQNE